MFSPSASIPTDNLHKFKALVGLLLFFGPVAWMQAQVHSIFEEMREVEGRAERSRLNTEELAEIVAFLKRNETKPTRQEISLLFDSRRALSDVKVAMDLVDLKRERLQSLLVVCLVMSLVGLWLALSGFRGWKRQQDRVDTGKSD